MKNYFLKQSICRPIMIYDLLPFWHLGDYLWEYKCTKNFSFPSKKEGKKQRKKILKPVLYPTIFTDILDPSYRERKSYSPFVSSLKVKKTSLYG